MKKCQYFSPKPYMRFIFFTISFKKLAPPYMIYIKKFVILQSKTQYPPLGFG